MNHILLKPVVSVVIRMIKWILMLDHGHVLNVKLIMIEILMQLLTSELLVQQGLPLVKLT
jgi:ABC-type spermidine/putrescine transport system permease subunit I